jgi:hypothetical protein
MIRKVLAGGVLALALSAVSGAAAANHDFPGAVEWLSFAAGSYSVTLGGAESGYPGVGGGDFTTSRTSDYEAAGQPFAAGGVNDASFTPLAGAPAPAPTSQPSSASRALEPVSWVLMIGGSGLMGYVLRRQEVRATPGAIRDRTSTRWAITGSPCTDTPGRATTGSSRTSGG